MKEENIKIRVNDGISDAFKKVCENEHTTMSDKLRGFINRELKEKPTEGLTFSEAMDYLNSPNHKKIKRNKWGSSYLTYHSSHPINGHLNSDHPDNELPETQPNGSPNITQGNGGQLLEYIMLKVEGDSYYWGKGYSDYIPWTVNQIDLFAKDWEVVE